MTGIYYGGPERTWCKYILTHYIDILSRYSGLLYRHHPEYVEMFSEIASSPVTFTGTRVVCQWIMLLQVNNVLLVHNERFPNFAEQSAQFFLLYSETNYYIVRLTI